MADRNVTIVLSDEQIEALDLASNEVGVSRSAIIRRAVISYLPRLEEGIRLSKPGGWADEIVYLLMGAPVRSTGDATDEEFRQALNTLRKRLKASKQPKKKRAGRPRKKKGANDA